MNVCGGRPGVFSTRGEKKIASLYSLQIWARETVTWSTQVGAPGPTGGEKVVSRTRAWMRAPSVIGEPPGEKVCA